MIAAAPADRLPDGFAVRLDPLVRRRDDGATLLGGSPLRLLRLSARARALLRNDRLIVRDPTGAALAARLLDAGLAHPELAHPELAHPELAHPELAHPELAHPDLPPFPAARDVTVVIPVRD